MTILQKLSGELVELIEAVVTRKDRINAMRAELDKATAEFQKLRKQLPAEIQHVFVLDIPKPPPPPA